MHITNIVVYDDINANVSAWPVHSVMSAIYIIVA